jgi:hypothetical protein
MKLKVKPKRKLQTKPDPERISITNFKPLEIWIISFVPLSVLSWGYSISSLHVPFSSEVENPALLNSIPSPKQIFIFSGICALATYIGFEKVSCRWISFLSYLIAFQPVNLFLKPFSNKL